MTRYAGPRISVWRVEDDCLACLIVEVNLSVCQSTLVQSLTVLEGSSSTECSEVIDGVRALPVSCSPIAVQTRVR